MSKIFLIRHGQASLGKANYDQLSDLGVRQAELLGSYFDKLQLTPDLVVQGSMQRHAQTASSLLMNLQCGAESAALQVQTNDLWNEFDFESLVKAYLAENSEELTAPKTPSDFFSLLKKALLAWSENKIESSLPETWLDFESRIRNALNELHTLASNPSNGTIFVVSSGGAISMALKQILGTSNQTMIDLNLQTKNTGITELFAKRGSCYLSAFNHVAHLSNTEHCKLITHA
jgi:broad specificity phosphatase PhoE